MSEVGSETGIEIRVSRCCGARAGKNSRIEKTLSPAWPEDNAIYTVGMCAKCRNPAFFDLEHEREEKK